MIQYVLGFVIWEERVLLIRKNRPTWQAGKFNGIGGKVEPQESAPAAMVRECWEEAAIHTVANEWRKFALMAGTGWECHCYVAKSDRLWSYRAVTDEMLGVFYVDALPDNCLPNVPYLVAMALDQDLQGVTYLQYR